MTASLQGQELACDGNWKHQEVFLGCFAFRLITLRPLFPQSRSHLFQHDLPFAAALQNRQLLEANTIGIHFLADSIGGPWGRGLLGRGRHVPPRLHDERVGTATKPS